MAESEDFQLGYKEYVAGMLAGVATVIVGHPFDSVKMKGRYRGATSSFVGMAFESSLIFGIYSQIKHLLQLTGIFRGGGTTFLRESFGNAVFFSTYEYVRYCMHKPLKDAPSELTHVIDVGVGIFSGGIGGIAFWSSVLPLHVAKTIIQTSQNKNHTRNPFRILELVYRRSGIR